SRWCRSASPAGASSAWRRSTIISKSSAGPRRRSSSASGSSPSCWRSPASPLSSCDDPAHRLCRTHPCGVRPRRVGACHLPGAFDDEPRKLAQAQSAGFTVADLRRLDWSRVAALVLTPGVPLTHPAPHWSVGLARHAAVEVIGDIELYCRQRRAVAPDAPFIAITGTNGKSTTTALVAHVLVAAGYSAERGGNIGTAILSLEPPRRGHAHVIECSSYQIDLAPSLDPSVGIVLNVSEDHLDRHGTLRDYAAIKERLVAGVQPGGTPIVGVDDNWGQAAAERIERAGRPVVRVSVRRPLPDGLYVEAEQVMRAAGGTARAVAHIGGIGPPRCAACTTPRTPPARSGPPLRWASTKRRSRRASSRFPA